MNCFYCDKILASKITFKKILESDDLLAFYHTKPSYQFHAVIIPKKDVSNLFDLKDDRIILKIFDAAKKIISKKRLDKFRIINNGGAYQDESHLHFHLVSGKRIR